MGKYNRFFITGGAGFIGSHLAEELLKRGYEVYIIDNLTTGSIDNINHLKKYNNFHYYIEDITNKALTSELVDACDAIYHLAASVGVKLIVEQPVNTIRNNVYTTDIILELAAKKGKKVIIASTSEVYGKGTSFPFKENQDLLLGATINSRWSYACSKILDEFLALAYLKHHKLPVIIARLFNIAGPRQTGRYGMVIPTFVRQALCNEPLTIYGTGKQTRCFMHVLDAVDVLYELCKNENAIGEIFNIGDTHEITIENLAYLIKELLKSESPIKYIPYNEAYEDGFEDMERRVPDINKLNKLLAYKPKRDLRQIIIDVANYESALIRGNR